MESEGYRHEWSEAVNGFLCLSIDRIVDYSGTQCVPDPTPTQSGIRHTFSRFAFGVTWDFIEGAVAANYAGSYYGAVEMGMYKSFPSADPLCPNERQSHVIRGSAISQEIEERFGSSHHRSSLLRRNSVFRFDGFLLHMAPQSMLNGRVPRSLQPSARPWHRSGVTTKNEGELIDD